MRTLLAVIFFLSVYSIWADQCQFVGEPEVYSERKTKDYNEDNKLVSFYPKLKDFKSFFPDTVKITGRLTRQCEGHQVKLAINFRKGRKQVHEHNRHGDHKRFETAERATDKARFLTKNSYETTVSLEGSTFTFAKVPHLRFYEKLDRRHWYHQVKYTISVVNDKGAVMRKKVLILDSPMSE